jgi:hypothetical protein
LLKTSEGAANGGSRNAELFCGSTQSASFGGSNEDYDVIGIVLDQLKLPLPKPSSFIECAA